MITGIMIKKTNNIRRIIMNKQIKDQEKEKDKHVNNEREGVNIQPTFAL